MGMGRGVGWRWGVGGVKGTSVNETDRPLTVPTSGIKLNSALTFSLGLFSSPHRQHFL